MKDPYTLDPLMFLMFLLKGDVTVLAAISIKALCMQYYHLGNPLT